MKPALRAMLGKRAGVAAGLLGILCVLAEFCFLFPALLVTPDARPFYEANVAVFRAILASSIFATFLLGTASIILLRSKVHGLFGIGLGCIALVLGGANAQALFAGERFPVAIGLDYFILELLVLGLLFIPLERLFALREQRIFRTGWQTDLKHFFVSHAGVQLLSFASMIPAQALFAVRIRFRENLRRLSRAGNPGDQPVPHVGACGEPKESYRVSSGQGSS